jgi:RNA polymerase-binding transcription factor DksA
MYTKTLKHLSIIKDELENLLESHSEKVLDTKSYELQDDIERNIINSINEVIEQIEMITEDIENGTYEIDVEDDEEY